MTTAKNLVSVADPMLPDDGGDFNADDEDIAGYQAMMSELPSIVSMAGFLDGDFDELHEIQNILAVSDDDEEGHAAAAAAVAAEVAEEAYIQALVPNPIPKGDILAGVDISATNAPSDQNVGFTSLVSRATKDTDPPESLPASTTMTVKAPAKRVHQQLQAALVTPRQPQPKKKIKLESICLAQTPAKLRTSSGGVCVHNPLLFGKPLQPLPEPKVDDPAPVQPNTNKVVLEPKTSLKPTRTPRALYPPGKPLKNQEAPQARKPLHPLTPEIISTYPVPSFLMSQPPSRPPLCKLTFRGNVDAVACSTESAIARVPAPPLKTESSGCIEAACNQVNSATASKKKASKKKKNSSRPKSMDVTAMAKKPAAKPAPKPAPFQDNENKETSAVLTHDSTPEVVQAAPASTNPPLFEMEELMVANPLANMPPSRIIPLLPPPPPPPPPPPSNPAEVHEGVAPTALSSTSDLALADAEKDNASCDDPEDSVSSKAKKPKGKKRRTAAERAQACRDRNRQHARNTRLRKKAFMDELKRTLLDLVDERDREAASREEEESKKEQRRTDRTRILQEFLNLRGHNEREEDKWAHLMKDSKAFQLTLPALKFQTTVHNVPSSQPEQVLVGVDEVMADAGYFASFLQSLGTTNGGDEENQSEISPVYLVHQFDDSPLLMDGTTGVLCWRANTDRAVSQGAKAELLLCGHIRATFCAETDKLVSAKLMYDTGIIQAQLAHSPHD